MESWHLHQCGKHILLILLLLEPRIYSVKCQPKRMHVIMNEPALMKKKINTVTTRKKLTMSVTSHRCQVFLLVVTWHIDTGKHFLILQGKKTLQKIQKVNFGTRYLKSKTHIILNSSLDYLTSLHSCEHAYINLLSS